METESKDGIKCREPEKTFAKCVIITVTMGCAWRDAAADPAADNIGSGTERKCSETEIKTASDI